MSAEGDPVVERAFERWRQAEHANASIIIEEGYLCSLNMTPIEKIVFFALKQRAPFEALRISPQKRIGRYRADFLVEFELNRPEKIIIECDGHEFHEKTKAQAQHDKKRDRELQKLGYRVYRFTGSEIWKTEGRCVLSALEIEPSA